MPTSSKRRLLRGSLAFCRQHLACASNLLTLALFVVPMTQFRSCLTSSLWPSSLNLITMCLARWRTKVSRSWQRRSSLSTHWLSITLRARSALKMSYPLWKMRMAILGLWGSRWWRGRQGTRSCSWFTSSCAHSMFRCSITSCHSQQL